LTKKNRFFLLTTVLTILSALLFNNIYASDFLVDTAKNLIDTTAVNLSDVYHNPHFLELASVLPFHDHYLNWDTTTIHPYHFDLTKMQDTVLLVLADHKDCAFMIPVAGYVTSNFGPRSRTRYHYGIDLKLNVGDSVSAAFDGIVRISHYSSSYGNCVVIRHYNGLETLYAHLSKRFVVPGQVVRAGDVIACGGTTGHSTGPHLHFEVRYLGQPIDPNEIIDFSDSNYHFLRKDTLALTGHSFEYLEKFRNSAKHLRATAGFRSVYVIRKGDTLGKIAVKNGTTINRICQLNRISRNSRLRPGKKLRVK
jgi:murein DD-endopeptidase MepM/ murein hydrolase activator NlpD